MWQICVCIGVLCLILEIFTPSMIFFNFSIAAFITAIVSIYTTNITALVLIFSVLSLIFIFTLRPLFLKYMGNSKKIQTGLENKYIGKTAKVIETVTKEKGAISIYDERWQARNIEDFEIPIGSTVEIVSNDSIIMNVKKSIV